MSLDKIGSEQFVALMMLNQMKSESSESNSGTFDIVMHSVLKSISNNESSTGEVTENKGGCCSCSCDKEEKTSNIVTENLNFKPIHNNITTEKVEETSKLSTKERIERAINKASKDYGVDTKLIKAIIKAESNFNPNVRSSAGAMGLMQLMPENVKAYGVKDPYNIEENIDAGTRHIRDYIKMFDGNIEMGLMAYNAGPGTMARRGVKSPSDLYKLPKETQNYVPKVLKYYREGVKI
ncbi:lytic transglycosylase domain-containing protein [Clostridium massiliamazoniense]|uniref:lytic transglycosylase domain-containing protein n=1 Tax=Clostridium massiliamazoniense TaxID=1347366 RepID=UPI0006D7FD3A|nr:lytic transglycosylase domain-containing protein [Clostridium massiliamazoniense]